MRSSHFKITTVRIICCAIILLGITAGGYWLIDGENSNTKKTFSETETTENATISPISINPSNTKKTEPANTGKKMQGWVIDEARIGIQHADILYRHVDKPADKACEEMQNVEFNLDNSTFETATDKEGYFFLSTPNQTTRKSNLSDNNSEANNDYCLLINAAAEHYYATTISLDADTFTEVIEIELQKHAYLTGTVEQPDGSSAANAAITYWISNPAINAQGSPTFCAKPESDEIETVTAKEDGTFELHTIADNTLCIQAAHANWSSSVIQEINLNKKSADVVLSLRPANILSGKVVDQDNIAVTNFALQLASSTPTALVTRKKNHDVTTTNSNGEFQFTAVDFGEYQLVSVSPNYSIAKPESVAILENENLAPLTVEVYPITLITGTVLNEQGQPLARVQVTSRSPLLPDQSMAKTYTNDQGYFELASQHRSKKVHEMITLMNQSIQSLTPSSTTENNFSKYNTDATACLSFVHTGHTSQELKLSTTEHQTDVGKIYLSTSSNLLTGKVVNHRDEGLAAAISFRFSPSDTQGHKAPTDHCSTSAVPIDTQTDAAGNFSLTLENLGVYELDIKTERYNDRRVTLNIQDTRSPIEIKLN